MGCLRDTSKLDSTAFLYTVQIQASVTPLCKVLTSCVSAQHCNAPYFACPAHALLNGYCPAVLVCWLSCAAVMQQRVAGMYFCYDSWTKWYEKTAGLLREELDSVSKGKGQGQDKAGKAGKETTRELQGKSKKDADTVCHVLHLKHVMQFWY